MLSVEPSVGRGWNHEVAAFRCPAASAEPIGGFRGPVWNHLMAETANLEASVGRDRRKLFGLQLAVAHRLINGHDPSRFGGQKKTGLHELFAYGAPEPLPSNSWRLMGGNNNRVGAARNHPMATQVWTHHLAKAAIEWVE
jgi:hypothetical protein